MGKIPTEIQLKLETTLRQLYTVYLYLRDHDLSEKSNTSRLLHEKNHSYLVSRLADELQELAGVQSGEHIHTGKQDDTVLEGSQVSYWLFLLAATNNLLMAAKAYLAGGGTDDRESIAEALGGHVCRCTGYVKIVDAVAAAARGDEFDISTTAEGRYTTMRSGGGE